MKKEPEELKFKALICVDLETLRSARTGLDNSMDIEDAIQNEFGWLNESGIYLEELKRDTPKKKKVK